MTSAARVIDFVYDRLQIDEAWSARGVGAFTWWAGELAQRVWAGPPRDVEGTTVTTVHIETTILDGVAATADTLSQLAGLNRLASLSAYVWAEDAGTLRLHASVSVTDDNWPLARMLALHAAAIQVADAHAEAAPLAEVFGAAVARRVAPNGSIRTEADDMLGVVEVYQERGEHGSPWGADEIAGLVQLEPRPWTRASSEAHRFDAALPWSGVGAASRLAIDSSVVHPALGSGLQIQLAVPADPRPTVVQRLNTAELDQPDAHQLGAWCLDDEHGLVFTTFVPSAAYVPNLARALAYHAAARNDWARAILLAG